MSNGKLRKKYIRCFFTGNHKRALGLILKHHWLASITVRHDACVMILEIHYHDPNEIILTFKLKGKPNATASYKLEEKSRS